MARFYVLAIEPTLFGDAALVREWGRLGTRGCRRLDLSASVEGAADSLHEWLARKRRRGYRLTARLLALRDQNLQQRRVNDIAELA